MSSIFKKFGQGILYLFVLPLLLIAVAIFGVYGIFLFIVLMIKSIVLFFKGKSLSSDLPEDIEAKRILYPEKAEPKPIVEEREPIVIVDRPTKPIYNELEPTRIESSSSEEETPVIESKEVEEIETSYEDDEVQEEPLYDNEEDFDDEEEEEESVEQLSVNELVDDEDEEEEEEIPTLEEESKIKEDNVENDDYEVESIFKDWRGE